ncbi:MAG: AraC family ligand binding domain-containing protein, partial [Clostridia bacterium]|nr:AraC family ligand binding domain-containing protein [Clostridia bacterium]
MYRKKVNMPDSVSSHHADGNESRLNLTYCFAEELGKIHVTESVFIDPLAAHTHEFVEIVCITEGCGIHWIDGESVRVCRGDIFLIDYGMNHTYEPLSEPFCWINVIFRPEFLGGEYPVLRSAVQLLTYLHDHRLQPVPDKS